MYADSKTGLMDPTALLKLAGDVARGMLHIHSMQIVHGDLKAHNILVTGADGLSAKVADFGLSVRMEQEQTHVSGVHAGTLTHMAPEILMSGRLSKAADVYAFGIIMFELLTGEKAFKGAAMHQLSADVCTKQLRPQFPLGSPPKVGLPGWLLVLQNGKYSRLCGAGPALLEPRPHASPHICRRHRFPGGHVSAAQLRRLCLLLERHAPSSAFRHPAALHNQPNEQNWCRRNDQGGGRN
eukprot:scaffold191589_cov45-Prasinocladus_malaysianus.AAC.2